VICSGIGTVMGSPQRPCRAAGQEVYPYLSCRQRGVPFRRLTTAYIAVLLTGAPLALRFFAEDDSTGAFTQPVVKAVASSPEAFVARERNKQTLIGVPAFLAGSNFTSVCADSRQCAPHLSRRQFRAGLVLARPNGSRAPPSAISFV
jgi:hypothetical protein